MAITTERVCPKCQGNRMYDNRESKTNPRAPDFKCASQGCDGAIWPPRNAKAAPPKAPYVQQDIGRLPNDDAQETAPVAGDKSTAIYLRAMDFVVKTIVPVWEAGKVPYTASDINAATATIMIDHQRRTGR